MIKLHALNEFLHFPTSGNQLKGVLQLPAITKQVKEEKK